MIASREKDVSEYNSGGIPALANASMTAVLPVNLPLPTKIVMQVCEPIDIIAEFGEDPDIDVVDAHVRSVMQDALDKLAHDRRLPIIG